MKVCYAIDIGGTAIKYSIFDEGGALLDKWQLPTNRSDAGAHILPEIAQEIKRYSVQHEIADEEIIGIGVGVPGSVDENGTVLVAPNLGWKTVDAGKALSELCGLPVCTLNDANAAALGEYTYGGGKGYKSMVLLTLGTGVGGGVVMNGKVMTGFAGAAGEVGHLCVNDQETRVCTCGRRGCLEQYSSATGIVHTYRELLAAGVNGTLHPDDRIDAKAVFDAWLSGTPDEAADEAVARLGYYLGKACSQICCVIAPEIIVIGGGVSHAGEPLLRLIRGNFEQFAYPPCMGTSFALAKIGNDAGIYGCAKLVLDQRA